MNRLRRRTSGTIAAPVPSATFRADLEQVLAEGYHGLRCMLLALAGLQLLERHRRRGASASEVAAVSLATVQVVGELLSRRHERLRPWQVLAATTVSGWLIFGWRPRSHERMAVRGWESEWTNWNPLFARLIDEDRARLWSALGALPHVRQLVGPAGRRDRTDALTGIALLSAADLFGRAFGTSLRARADLIDARAGEFVDARTELEEKRVSAGWREEVVAASIERLSQIQARLAQPRFDEAQAASLVAAEYETLRAQIVEAGQSDAVIGDWEVVRASELERDAEQLARDTRRALSSLTRHIFLGSFAMVGLGVASSPPSRRGWIALAPVVTHLGLLGRPSRAHHLRGDRSSTVRTNLDLAILAVGYHLADMVTSVEGERHGAWATTCVSALAMPAAASAETPGGAMLPAVSYGLARLISRCRWARDDSNWVEVLNASLYFAWTSWALHRAIDAIWDAEDRLERWTTESGRHTAEVVMESNWRRVQLALHDHGVQTLRYLGRHEALPAQQRLDLLERAIAELSSVAQPDDPRGSIDLESAAAECLDGYRRFGLDPVLEVVLDRSSGTPSPGRHTDETAPCTDVIQDAVNQGLANVLAHSSDRCPVVRVSGDRSRLEVSVSNAAGPNVRPAAPLGFGLSQLEERVHACGGTMALGTEGGVTELRVTVPLAPPTAEPTA